MGVLLEESRQHVYNVGILGTRCSLAADRLGPNQDCGSEGDPAGYSLKENREPGTKKKRLLKGPLLSAFHLEPWQSGWKEKSIGVSLSFLIEIVWKVESPTWIAGKVSRRWETIPRGINCSAPRGKESPVAVRVRHHGRAKLDSETRRKVRIALKAQKHSRV